MLAGLAGSVLVAAIGPPLTAQEKAERRPSRPSARPPREAERQAAAEARAAEKQAAAERRAADKQAAAEAKARRRRGQDRERGPGDARPGASKASDQRTDDDLMGWPSALEDKPTRVATASGTAAVRDPDDDLADDDYAPSRAYRSPGRTSDADARAYATDTVEPEPAANDKPAEDKPRPGPEPPLWPGRPVPPPAQPTADDADGGGTDPDGPAPADPPPEALADRPGVHGLVGVQVVDVPPEHLAQRRRAGPCPGSSRRAHRLGLPDRAVAPGDGSAPR